VVDEIVVGFEDAVGEPVIAHKLPDIFDRVEFGTFRRQWEEVMFGGTMSRVDMCQPA
jgi:hypothetical protein